MMRRVRVGLTGLACVFLLVMLATALIGVATDRGTNLSDVTTNDAAPSGFYHAMHWLYGAPILMALWLMRIWLLSHRTELHDDPVVFALRDPPSLLMGAALGFVFFSAI